MLPGWLIVLVSFSYLGLLFAIAYYGDRRAEQGRSLIGNPYIYALSLAVYCTAWTFYGSVGRAASTGVGFLPIYLGPTLMFALGWFVLRKIVRISKRHHITSIADFVSSRYGKSTLLSGLVTLIAVVGIMPYIALQLKAVSTSFTVLLQYPEVALPAQAALVPVLQDKVFYVALVMAVFAILFGTRHIDVTEHHEGMVAAIAFESVVKLLAFLTVGLFVTYGLFGGFGDIFGRAAAQPELAQLFVMGEALPPASWAALILISMSAIVFLPRQFQVMVVENVNEEHLNKAIWLLPLYLLLINIFVLPIAFAGLLYFPGGAVDPDSFVLALPIAEQAAALALFVFIGGLSAATSMVIVESIALATMLSNDLLMPVLLRMRFLRLAERRDLSRLLLGMRRAAILLLLLLGYGYFRLTGEAYALVAIGLISFAAVAQFAPVILGGIFWKGGSRAGALAGLTAGFVLWAYTLLLPSFARSGWMPLDFLEQGPWGIELLRPYALFGLEGFDDLTHGVFWSLLANVGFYVGVSLVGRQSAIEYSQAALFVDVFRPTPEGAPRLWRGTASAGELRSLLARFLGEARTNEAFTAYARRRGVKRITDLEADAELVSHAERLLAGAIGAASARVMVASVVAEEPIGTDEVMRILDETSQAIAYSRELEQKSRELETATRELREANERLRELDRLKDDFISTVTHELRTPLTSIRAFSEILHDSPELATEQRTEFLGIVIMETERLTRLINQVLDLEKIESGMVEWRIEPVDVGEAIEDCVSTTGQIFREKEIALEVELPPALPPVLADRDRMIQVLTNLIANAVKFSEPGSGRVVVRAAQANGEVQVDVQDNGPGIRPEDQALIFEKFGQVLDATGSKPQGTGLGLPISRRIVEHLGGRIWVESAPGRGATFSFTVPIAPPSPGPFPAGGEGRTANSDHQPVTPDPRAA